MLAILSDIYTKDILHSLFVFTGVALTLNYVIYPLAYVFRVKWRSRALNVSLAPASERYWSADYYLLRNYLKLDMGALFNGLEPKNTSGLYRCFFTGPFDCVVRDPQLLKQILSGPTCKYFGRNENFKSSGYEILGDGIFNTEMGSIWKLHRDTLVPFFSKTRSSDVNLDRIDGMIMTFYECSKTDSAFNIVDRFHKFTFDNSLEFIAGVKSNNSHGECYDNNYASEIVQAFEILFQRAFIRFFLGSFKHIYNALLYPFKSPKMALNTIMDKLIDDALDRKASDNTKAMIKSRDYPTFLDYLVVRVSDRHMLRDQLYNTIVAARDSSASILSSIIYQLSEHPEIYREMRNSVINTLGPNGSPDSTTIMTCPLVGAIIKETLRFLTPVPIFFRGCKTDTVLKASDGKDYLFPRNSLLMMNFWALQRDPDCWGHDADKWDPFRWLDDRRQKVIDNPVIFLAFGSGPRVCPGQQFVYQLASIMLARMCQAFQKIERATDIHPEIFPSYRLILHWKDGIYVRMIPDTNFNKFA